MLYNNDELDKKLFIRIDKVLNLRALRSYFDFIEVNPTLNYSVIKSINYYLYNFSDIITNKFSDKQLEKIKANFDSKLKLTADFIAQYFESTKPSDLFSIHIKKYQEQIKKLNPLPPPKPKIKDINCDTFSLMFEHKVKNGSTPEYEKKLFELVQLAFDFIEQLDIFIAECYKKFAISIEDLEEIRKNYKKILEIKILKYSDDSNILLISINDNTIKLDEKIKQENYLIKLIKYAAKQKDAQIELSKKIFEDDDILKESIGNYLQKIDLVLNPYIDIYEFCIMEEKGKIMDIYRYLKINIFNKQLLK